jgi:hypothetical protein
MMALYRGRVIGGIFFLTFSETFDSEKSDRGHQSPDEPGTRTFLVRRQIPARQIPAATGRHRAADLGHHNFG